jgi:Flp pilus assembly protein TadD
MTAPFPPDARKSDSAVASAIQALRRGDAATAAVAAHHATQLDPHDMDAWWLFGVATTDLWMFAEAEAAFAKGYDLTDAQSPRRGAFLVHRARALAGLAHVSEACALAEKALTEGVSDPQSLAIAGNVLIQCGRQEAGLRALSRALALRPDGAEAAEYWLHTAEALHYLGDLDAAETGYEKAIALTSPPAAHLALAKLRKWGADNNHIARLETQPQPDAPSAAAIGYALFKELDDIGETDAAWRALEAAAAAARDQYVPAERGAWSVGQPLQPLVRLGAGSQGESALTAAWKRHFPIERFEAPLPHVDNGAPRRIFVLGLPRSGTTLVERILGAHSQVQAQGELQAMWLGVKTLSQSSTPAILDEDVIMRAARMDMQALADFYRKETAFLSDGSLWATDKLPHNYAYAGLIRLAFPDAVIVHVQREPMDSLFGAYKQLFGHVYRWSYSQTDLAELYGAYIDLMRHWREALLRSGRPMIEIRLEALIADPENEIRHLLDNCGLPFEAACLTPHRSGGAVATASATQVRRQINADGVGAWRRYATQLAPLRRRLFEQGFIDEDGDGRF